MNGIVRLDTAGMKLSWGGQRGSSLMLIGDDFPISAVSPGAEKD